MFFRPRKPQEKSSGISVKLFKDNPRSYSIKFYSLNYRVSTCVCMYNVGGNTIDTLEVRSEQIVYELYSVENSTSISSRVIKAHRICLPTPVFLEVGRFVLNLVSLKRLLLRMIINPSLSPTSYHFCRRSPKRSGF